MTAACARHAAACSAGMLALAVALGGAAAAPPGAALRGLQARVEHVVDLPALSADGVRLRELSALAWDPQAQELVAASDRGRVVRLRLVAEQGRLVVRVGDAQRLQLPDDAVLKAEALFWRTAPGGGRLWAGGEHDGQAWALDGQGRGVRAQPWPQALQRAAEGRHGVEALAWHEPLGLLAGLQKSRSWRPGDARRFHAVHAEGARHWLWAPAASGSALKAIEPWPGQGLLVLERLPADAGAEGSPQRLWRPRLRLLWLLHCGQTLPCEAQEVPLTPPLPDGPLNFEGLACAGDGRCWLVSDGGADGQVPARLVQLRLQPVP
jgi:Esterase-like activity of phytase